MLSYCGAVVLSVSDPDVGRASFGYRRLAEFLMVKTAQCGESGLEGGRANRKEREVFAKVAKKTQFGAEEQIKRKSPPKPSLDGASED
jgi:hypothetical protein